MKTVEDGWTFHPNGLAESILWKQLYYQKEFMCSMQSPSKLQWHSSHRYKNQS
jgi:hypothetical protein